MSIMAAAKKAYYTYNTDTEYFCEAIHADWVPLPSLGIESATVALKVTLLIHFGLTDNGPVEPPGRQAALYFPFSCTLEHAHEKHEYFLRDAGVALLGSQRASIQKHHYIICRFGKPDRIFAFQPVAAWRPSSKSQFFEYRNQLEAIRKPTALPFGLKKTDSGDYSRGKDRTLDLTTCPKLRELFEALLTRHPEHYSANDLARDVWKRADALQSVYQGLRNLRKILHTSTINLDIPTAVRGRYRLSDCR